MVKLERKLIQIGAEDGGRRLSSGRRQYVRDHEGAQNEVAEHHCEASQMSGDSSELSVTLGPEEPHLVPSRLRGFTGRRRHV